MRRYYSHYTFIYPDIYLKNHVVELDYESKITKVFPFEKEIEKTEFYSGLVLFLPLEIGSQMMLIENVKEKLRNDFFLDCISEITIKEIIE